MKKKRYIFLIFSILLINCGQETISLSGEWTGIGSAKYQVDYIQKTILGNDTLTSTEKKDSIVQFRNVKLYLSIDTFSLIGLDIKLHGMADFRDTITKNNLSTIDLINHNSYEYEVAAKESELEKNGMITIDVNAENAIRGEQFEFDNDTLNIWFSLGRSTDTQVEYNLKLKK